MFIELILKKFVLTLRHEFHRFTNLVHIGHFLTEFLQLLEELTHTSLMDQTVENGTRKI